ncbi:MAG: redox-regulated ATPase YchF [Pseudanabaena sp.]|jgi:GTP-binding protein YchF|nr:redox-regulated ATPase YchF [Pseudanabaena sp. M090S1SP2A07QC]MCA6505936.1 redox-regulated ATPase YchF [Pseudanabaena sp. M172S2SP2A07QC]MCA6508516.1 redox-regulated ATPase YchF [Pseudanabaena sp. M109S1SP2A07QC]MCA6517919.1 redox-regulated ATPase YchF [Pseudanabaena sp. M110S1SP2A07QC]MCA6522476.1 redox-regulated ATPase YchF [Pseudanabaena sp. M051S1SP2A07QC]MCA6525558.1 redox-regulated ATPase YchF [Pseudanabaena sp. M179S2SP2A07QC]MCA6530008.1 redox-regulated ATPase YchF [Pseudanabaena s
MLKAGIVGLPNVGKSTLFNALVANAKAEAANFPFCTIEPNVGSVSVPDDRLNTLAAVGKSAQIIATRVEFVDIAGLVRGASKGEGLGNQFLGNIRVCDAIVHVVRCFENDDIIHVETSIDPGRDIEIITLELALSDLSQVDRRIERTRKAARADADAKVELAALEKVRETLDAGKPARLANLTGEEKEAISVLQLLTLKPTIYAANVSEDDLATGNAFVDKVRAIAAAENAEVTIVSAQVESELLELTDEERQDFLESLGVKEGGLKSLIRATYHLLGLRTYFTVGPKEARAWTIHAGMKAPQAAGVIHSDFEKAFIRAETVAFKDLVDCGSMSVARSKGLLRSEGKEYVVQEGDVILFLTSA